MLMPVAEVQQCILGAVVHVCLSLQSKRKPPVDNRRTFRSVETRATEKVFMSVSPEKPSRSEQYHEFKHVQTLHVGRSAFHFDVAFSLQRRSCPVLLHCLIPSLCTRITDQYRRCGPRRHTYSDHLISLTSSEETQNLGVCITATGRFVEASCGNTTLQHQG
jgi:hypothetical protein